MMDSLEKISNLSNRLGITDQSGLYLYDARGGCEASRVRWIFERYGFKAVYIIDSGKQAGLQSGHYVNNPNSGSEIEIKQ